MDEQHSAQVAAAMDPPHQDRFRTRVLSAELATGVCPAKVAQKIEY
jgi:hypothetical protein